MTRCASASPSTARSAAEEDLRPHEDAARARWHCRSCTRVFTVKLVGLA